MEYKKHALIPGEGVCITHTLPRHQCVFFTTPKEGHVKRRRKTLLPNHYTKKWRTASGEGLPHSTSHPKDVVCHFHFSKCRVYALLQEEPKTHMTCPPQRWSVIWTVFQIYIFFQNFNLEKSLSIFAHFYDPTHSKNSTTQTNRIHYDLNILKSHLKEGRRMSEGSTHQEPQQNATKQQLYSLVWFTFLGRIRSLLCFTRF